MYPKELEELIDIALADGVLTEKEKRILFKSAEARGIDLDEFEMVLESKLFEKQQTLKSIKETPVTSKSEKFGDVRKCPACGALVESFAIKCSDCGTEFRNIEASQNVVKFFDKLREFELGGIDDFYNENKNKIGCTTIILWLFFWYILLPIKIIKLIINACKPAKWTSFDIEKEEFIMNYPIPTSREDILEFIILLTSKIENLDYTDLLSDKGKVKNCWNKIWLQKIGQIKNKAALLMKDDKKYIEINQMIDNAKKIHKKNRNKVLHILIMFLVLIALFFGLIGNISFADDKQINEEKVLMSQIEMHINNGKIGLAKKEMARITNTFDKQELSEKLQFAELSYKLNKIDSLIENKNFDKARSALKKMIWTPVGGYISSSEKELIKSFLRKKEIVNRDLPAKYRVKIESIDDYIK
jgi:hypothetical protein